jgi:hypothetical protein
MIKPLSVAILATLPFLFSACCTHAQPRFWKVRDTAGGGTAYTVDTVAVPASSLVPRDIRYVDSTGKYVAVQSPKVVKQLTEQEWKAATSGAGYSLNYCGHRKGCWAKTKAR